MGLEATDQRGVVILGSPARKRIKKRKLSTIDMLYKGWGKRFERLFEWYDYLSLCS